MSHDIESTNKSLHGAKGIESLRQMLHSLADRDYIVTIKDPYKIGDPGIDEKQFYFQFLIEFHDNEQWILQHTTSFRSDRVKEQQWDSENIKRLNSNVKKAILVVPDDLPSKEQAAVSSYNARISEGKTCSYIDEMIPFDEAFRQIENKATSIMNPGTAIAKRGLNFEKKVESALNNKPNLERWKNNSTLEVGYLFSLFKDIMENINVNKQEIVSLRATTDIPKLQSGGSPKADVWLVVETNNGSMDFTFSCKRSTADRVSVHEYTADAFANVLNPDDGELREMLIEFQQAGGKNALGEEKSELLERRLVPYRDKLALWALGGIGGEGDEKTQWASHIITVNENTNEYHISTIEKYIEQFKKQGIKGNFGTPFQWTYPSGGKGKRIQLKGKML